MNDSFRAPSNTDRRVVATLRLRANLAPSEASLRLRKLALIPFSLGVLLVTFPCHAFAQSGSGGVRSSGREYAVNLTFGAYQYDAARSPAMQEVTRLASTASTAQEEIDTVKDKHKLEELAVRHVRSVGLRSGESFSDAVLLGPEYMVFSVTPREVVRGFMKLDVRVRYANESLLEVKGVELENFETILLRGGKGMFGVKYFVGAGGSQESVPIERTLLVSVTPEIVPAANLRNRPQEISHPVDEYGGPLKTSEADRFTAPVPLERVPPKFEAGRAVKGSVLLGGVVTPEGKIINVRVLRSLDAVIDERAIDAFRQYRFSPALLNGKPVHATYREELTFAPPPPSILEMEEEQRKRRELEREKEKQKRRKP
ncbi:MAG TPA: energy transducer TonB [Blastocatellia bacterium]|nr:energy transducer TonB [Blastocatellia bacterium]